MYLDENGQASVEFLFVTLVVLIILVGFVGLITNEQSQTSTGNLAQARMTGELAAETINTVYINGAGYSANLTVPSNMNIIINNPSGYVTVNMAGQSVSSKLIPINVQSKTLNNGTTYMVSNAVGNNSNYFITFT